jgi:hypothetical protein
LPHYERYIAKLISQHKPKPQTTRNNPPLP